MKSFELTEDTIRVGLEEADQLVAKAEADLKAAHDEREFWHGALNVFEAAKARAEGQPVPASAPQPSSPKQRGLYKGSAGHQIVSLLHDEAGMEYDDLVTAMVETESVTTLSDPVGAIDRALKRLVDRGFVDRDAQVLTITDAGLAAEKITNGSAPTGGALDTSRKEDHMDPP